MKLCVIAHVCLLLSASALAAVEKPEMVKLGGEGKFVFVNAADVDQKILDIVAQRIGGMLMIETEVQKGTWTFGASKQLLRETKGNAVVFVVKDEKLPMSLIAMEEKWGVANVAGLSDKAIAKEAIRVATVVLGAASSKYPSSVMQPVFSGEDLEKQAGDLLTIDSLMAIYPSLTKIGIKQYDLVDYADALEEGVAPAPVNERQRKLKEEFDRKQKAK